MSGDFMTAAATVIAAFFTAIAGSGIVGYFQSKGKTTIETKQIEEDIIMKVRQAGDAKSDVLIARAELHEWRFDMLMEQHLKLIDNLRMHCAASDLAELDELRTEAFRLKYTNHIDGRPQPPDFPPH